MNDPLDVVFVSGDEAAELKRADTARKLATYLKRIPVELRGLFAEQFQHISRAELAQLRDSADELQRIRELIDPLEGQSVYDAVDALLHDESSVEIYKAEIAEQARKLDEARKALLAWHVVELNECGEDIFPLMRELDEMDLYESGDDLAPWSQELRRAWLAAHPAPQEPQ